jgi:hypothetical protein
MAEQTSDADHLTAFASDAAIIIAHNAAFDRKFAERYWPVFAVKPWACSVNQIEWRAHGPFPRPIAPHYHCCLRTPAEKQFGYGLNTPRSTSKTTSNKGGYRWSSGDEGRPKA